QHSDCLKFPADWPLDLKETAYVLFKGKVRVTPPGAAPFELSAGGKYHKLPVVGIVTDDGRVDGDGAVAVEDSVCVSFRHEALLELQRAVLPLRQAWEKLLTERVVKAGVFRRGGQAQLGG